jgi:hypothetical protein
MLIYPVGLARSLYHLFRDKVPLTYPTRFSVGYSGYFVSLILRHTVSHTDNYIYISDFIKVIVNTSIHYLFCNIL